MIDPNAGMSFNVLVENFLSGTSVEKRRSRSVMQFFDALRNVVCEACHDDDRDLLQTHECRQNNEKEESLHGELS